MWKRREKGIVPVEQVERAERGVWWEGKRRRRGSKKANRHGGKSCERSCVWDQSLLEGHWGALLNTGAATVQLGAIYGVSLEHRRGAREALPKRLCLSSAIPVREIGFGARCGKGIVGGGDET